VNISVRLCKFDGWGGFSSISDTVWHSQLGDYICGGCSIFLQIDKRKVVSNVYNREALLVR